MMDLDTFAKLDSDVCVTLKNENSDYRRLLEEMSAILNANPTLLAFWDQDAAVSLSQQDAVAFQSYRKLKSMAEDMERYAIYWKGYQDGIDGCKQNGPK